MVERVIANMIFRNSISQLNNITQFNTITEA